MPPIEICPDGRPRCHWCTATPEYLLYHDREWGFPVADDRRLFEKLCLEGFQAGLSWLTILRKRDAFRKAFDDFDFAAIARYRPRKVETLLANPGIVRHRGKIESVLNNARRALEVCEHEGSLGALVWRYEPEPEEHRKRGPVSTSPESAALSKELKRRGWSFVGPTTVYAFMQAMGMVNDHDPKCIAHGDCERARRAFKRPR